MSNEETFEDKVQKHFPVHYELMVNNPSAFNDDYQLIVEATTDPNFVNLAIIENHKWVREQFPFEADFYLSLPDVHLSALHNYINDSKSPVIYKELLHDAIQHVVSIVADKPSASIENAAELFPNYLNIIGETTMEELRADPPDPSVNFQFIFDANEGNPLTNIGIAIDNKWVRHLFTDGNDFAVGLPEGLTLQLQTVSERCVELARIKPSIKLLRNFIEQVDIAVNLSAQHPNATFIFGGFKGDDNYASH